MEGCQVKSKLQKKRDSRKESGVLIKSKHSKAANKFDDAKQAKTE